ELYNLMKQKGASFPGTVAKIAGGAQMFQGNSGVFNIGERNIQAVKIVLSKLNIPIVAEDTGLNYGRTVFFDAQTGTMQVKSAMNPIKNL
ncbi:MAG: chemotaxis protein CheD, partial [Oscillospiraceae bacterium]|nr:chemotaxis protein CheD [Oscillospiraceae bacterium]